MLDTECYRNYFLIQFYNPASGKLTYFELTDDLAPQTDYKTDMEKVRAILRQFRIVTFNGINYDLPLVFLYLTGRASCGLLKKASDDIIATGLKYWHLEQRYGFTVSQIDHVDLIGVAPGKASLKLYGGRLHCKKLQDLPIEPHEAIALEQRLQMREYCANDLLLTCQLYQALKAQIELRENMSAEYGVDLRSKSDAQIAESVISNAIEKETKSKPKRVEVPPGTVFRYTAPAFIRFETPVMNEVLERMRNAQFFVSDGGKIIMPQELAQPIHFYGNEYRIGIGGLHSSEECAAHVADDEHLILDRDVQSYYPAIILNCGLYPEHLGKTFLKVYRQLVDDRLEAKKQGKKAIADSLKITVNGSFGKLGSRYSFLYSPQLLLQTTLTGQLSLLMLIERIAEHGRVISANTDGCTFTCRRGNKAAIDRIVKRWEKDTGFLTEETEYRALFSRDVNNYIAIKTDGKVKSKGAYTPAGLNKNPTCEICVDAVVAYLKNNIPIDDTIQNSTDFTKFVAVRKVTGGAVHADAYLGKTVRFYYRKGVVTAIHYKTNGYLVPKTEGAWPCMELPNDFPQDIDYDKYIHDAEQMLRDIGERLW